MKYRSALFGLVGASLAGSVAFADNPHNLSPQQVAAAYETATYLDRDTSQDMMLLNAYAMIVSHQLISAAESIGAIEHSKAATKVPCESGSITVASEGGVLRTLTGNFEACVIYRDGLDHTRDGILTVQLLLVPGGKPEITFVQFGTATAGFVEQREFSPLRPGSLAPPRSTLAYQMAGRFLESDEFGTSSDGTYHYVIDGTFSEDDLLPTTGGEELRESFVIDANHLEVLGTQRTTIGSEPTLSTTQHFERGALIHDSMAQLGNATPTFGRKQYRFDDFTILNARNVLSGATEHAYDGFVDIELSDDISHYCRRGALILHTAQPMDEIGENRQEFTRGLIFIDHTSSIRFLSNNAVRIHSAGSDPVELSNGPELQPFGLCYY